MNIQNMNIVNHEINELHNNTENTNSNNELHKNTEKINCNDEKINLTNEEIINEYNNLCTLIYVAISKINANIDHGKNYGIISNKISENFIKLFEYDITYIYTYNSESNVIINRINVLKQHYNLLQNILEKQRMCFIVNYFCNTDTKSAFPTYLIPLLKSKYIKLYSNIIFQNISSKIYFKNYELIELN